jgi:hypothetical protein
MNAIIRVREIADRWTGAYCWLDGKLATVSGRLNSHATIAILDGSQSVQFAWATVNRIMYGKMEFRS